MTQMKTEKWCTYNDHFEVVVINFRKNNVFLTSLLQLFSADAKMCLKLKKNKKTPLKVAHNWLG